MEREDGRTKVQVEKITRQVLAARLEDDMEREVRGQVQVEKMTRRALVVCLGWMRP